MGLDRYVTLKILAVTSMKQGICVAGVSESFSWYRPVRKKGLNLLTEHIFFDGCCVLKKYNIVRFKMHKELVHEPHSEDFLIDWSVHPQIVGVVADEYDKKLLYSRLDETQQVKTVTIPYFLQNNNRSLMMIRPDEILDVEWDRGFEGHQVKIVFRIGSNTYSYSCTDLQWKALGDSEEKRKGSLDFLCNSEVYLSVGLTRFFKGKYYPIIIGVHPIPDMEVEIDYDQLSKCL
jgi:hypothetical protein